MRGARASLEKGVGRRDFVFSLVALPFAPAPHLAAALESTTSALETGFEPEERRLLGFFCEQIIPRDEFPGAIELGVVAFIEKTLLAAHPDWGRLYRAGLEALRASTQRSFGCGFDGLPFDQQTALLKKMEGGQLDAEDWRGVSCQEFFRMVRDHTLQGAYSHPRYGGNRDRQAWKMIGYDDPWSSD